jgi:transposase InsO family protein
MAYSNNPNLINARRETLLAVISQGMPICTAARRFGVHRVTIWRWIERWKKINRNVKERNYNRPSRPHSFNEKLMGTDWKMVSVSTIERIIARHNLQKTKRRTIRRTLPRPNVNTPGDLVEIDTVHYVDKLTGERRYICTVIDLFTRIAYAECFERILPGNTLRTLLNAEKQAGFRFRVVQSDNGPEFSKWFTARIETKNGAGVARVHRHIRIHRPNDNAHIERFNRTLREECIGDHMSCRYTTEGINRKLKQYLDYYNNERLHLGIQCRTPCGMLRR